MRFEKWQALGNDYLIVERAELPFELTPARVRRICDPHFGVGSDGDPAAVEPAEPRARRRPADLQPRRLGGRAVRQRGARGDPVPAPPRLDRRRRVRDRDRRRQDPPDDHRPRHVLGGHGQREPRLPGLPRRAARRARRARTSTAHDWGFRHVSIGNPQCAIRVASRRSCRRSTWRRSDRAICNDPRFPNRTNVSWFVELAGAASSEQAARIRARIFERGVGETLSSGTGASGAAVAYAEDQQPRPGTATVVVSLDGGELEVEVGEDLQVTLTGWARPVCAGRSAKTSKGSCMKPSKRLERIPPYAFAQLERKIADKRAAGVDVISLGIGDPDRPDAAADRGGDAGGGHRARNPPIPDQPRPRGLPRGGARLLRAALRRGARPRRRDDPGDRRQGGDLQPQPRVPRPGRLRARGRPRLPGLHGRPVAGRRRAGADGAGARARLHARPRRDRRATSPSGPS